MTPRWRGQPGRLEVWYWTVSDPASGTGLWVHHETVAPSRRAGQRRLPIRADPSDGAGTAPFAHGWVAAFLAGRRPVLERFGPTPAVSGVVAGGDRWNAEGRRLSGSAGTLQWDLSWDDDGDPLWTFPEWAWGREALPAAHVVPAPTARFHGTLAVGGATIDIADAPGSVARIYGHGNAEQWGWLHGDLGGGDVIEVVVATPHRRGLDRLRPLAFVRLRHGGRDWPSAQLAAAPLFRTTFGDLTWSVSGTVGPLRLTANVTMSEDNVVAVGYVDPDGTTATCTNSELADAEVVLERRRERWEVVASWVLRGTAHAEIGRRP